MMVLVHAVQANCGDFGFGALKQTVVVVALVLVVVHICTTGSGRKA